MTEYRIDDLALTVGVTVRNIRAYQDRGLLAPPRIEGRVGLYSEEHLARLRIISSFLDRGYNTAQIAELLGAWRDGKGLADIIGFDEHASPSAVAEEPVEVATAEVTAILGDDSGDLLTRFAALGWVAPDGDRCLVVNPRLVNAVREAGDYGFGAEEIIELHEAIAPHVSEVAQRAVQTATRHLLDEHGENWLPSDNELVGLTTMVERLRELASLTVQEMLARGMQEHIEAALAAHVGRVLAQNDENAPDIAATA